MPYKAKLIATTLSEEQMAFLRQEFPKDSWRDAELLRVIIRDYFEAREMEFPPDENTHGGRRRAGS